MNICTAAALAAFFLASSLDAQPSTPAPKPHYQWTKGETFRYLIQRDPYFDDPKAAIETVGADAPYRPPVVERLTEKVLSVAASGAATLLLTLAPEPGFEEDNSPQPPLSRTVTVSPTGQIMSVTGPPLGDGAAERDLLLGLAPLPTTTTFRKDGLAVVTRSLPTAVTHSTSPDHDGTLLQTTSAAQSDHLVFSGTHGRLERKISTLTVTLSLVMTGRGRRGSDDFGHVIPNVQVVQTLSMQRQPN